MKSTLILISFFVVSILSAQSYSTTSVYTRNGTAVEGLALTSGELSSGTKASIYSDISSNYPNVTILSEATNTYNCHGFAWNLSEGNSNVVWIDATDMSSNPNIDRYWSDGSFIKVCSESEADKIHYYSGDHSAIISTAVSGKYESKWGQECKVRHDPTDVPSIYNSSYRDYYASTRISGSYSELCSGNTRTFSVKSITGATYSWSCSSSLTINSGGTTNQVTVQYYSDDPNAWVQVQITTPCSSLTATSTAHFVTGPPNVSFSVVPSYSGETFCTSSFGQFSISPSNTLLGYAWGYSSYTNSISPTTINSAGTDQQNMSFSLGGYYQIFARPYNSCGLGNTNTLDIFVNDNCSGGLSTSNVKMTKPSVEGNVQAFIFPNPVIDILHISIPVNRINLKNTYIRLTDSNGKVVKSVSKVAGTTDINISNFASGIYLVEIGDGKTKIIQKVIKIK